MAVVIILSIVVQVVIHKAGNWADMVLGVEEVFGWEG